MSGKENEGDRNVLPIVRGESSTQHMAYIFVNFLITVLVNVFYGHKDVMMSLYHFLEMVEGEKLLILSYIWPATYYQMNQIREITGNYHAAVYGVFFSLILMSSAIYLLFRVILVTSRLSGSDDLREMVRDKATVEAVLKLIILTVLFFLFFGIYESIDVNKRMIFDIKVDISPVFFFRQTILVTGVSAMVGALLCYVVGFVLSRR